MCYIIKCASTCDSRDRQGNVWLPKNMPETQHDNKIIDCKSQQIDVFIELFNH